MIKLPEFIVQVKKPAYRYKYSVCTLLTRKNEYLEMLGSFLQAGFTQNICEYLVIDNSEANAMDAYQGINSFLKKATGEYIIICHQDIVLSPDTSSIQDLNQRIAEITALDPDWAVLGNAGAADRLYKRYAYKINYPNRDTDIKGTLPQKVCSVDENFILVKNSANLSVSGNAGGFHLYGLDLCMTAGLMGYTCYAVDFLLLHKSLGNVDEAFDQSLKQLKNRYNRFVKNRYINTTIALFYLSGSNTRRALFETRIFRRVIKTAEEIRAKITGTLK